MIHPTPIAAPPGNPADRSMLLLQYVVALIAILGAFIIGAAQ